jgi:alpha-beta hydrolase superfamily lysophospholipase
MTAGAKHECITRLHLCYSKKPVFLGVTALGLMSCASAESTHHVDMTAHSPQVFRLLDDITGQDKGKPWTVYVTGHSLGGALATLCAFELAARQ